MLTRAVNTTSNLDTFIEINMKSHEVIKVSIALLFRNCKKKTLNLSVTVEDSGSSSTGTASSLLRVSSDNISCALLVFHFSFWKSLPFIHNFSPCLIFFVVLAT